MEGYMDVRLGMGPCLHPSEMLFVSAAFDHAHGLLFSVMSAPLAEHVKQVYESQNSGMASPSASMRYCDKPQGVRVQRDRCAPEWRQRYSCQHSWHERVCSSSGFLECWAFRLGGS